MFPVDRRALRPQFEAYRLASSTTPSQQCYALPVPAAAHTSDASLGYKELKARAMHGALTPLPGVPQFAYVDAEGFVTLLALNDAPQFVRVHRTIPTATLCAMDTRTLVVCDSHTLTHLTLDPATFQANAHTYPIPDVCVSENEHALPWRILAADNGAVLLERARKRTESGATPGVGATVGTRHAQTRTCFDVALVRNMHLIWTLVSDEPISVARLGPSCLLGAEVALGPSGMPRAPPVASVPAGNRPPYSWTQTKDSLTLAFGLPASVTKHDIRVRFSHRGLSVGLALPSACITELNDSAEEANGPNEVPHADTAEALRRGQYEARALWGEVHAHECVWTWEHVQTRTSGDTYVTSLLTLHLAKAHEGTRWPTVLEGDDVVETLDPSELVTMLEGLEKYTEMPGPTSLLQDGLEEEDTRTGAPLVLTEVLPDGSLSQPTTATPSVLLAHAAPSNTPDDRLLLKHDVDGIVYAPPSPSDTHMPWAQEEVIPAMAYVLASKQDARPYLVRSSTPGSATTNVFALESRHSAKDGALKHTVYVYHAPPQSNYGSSCVFRLEEQATSSSALLGVAITPDARLVCLCETAVHVVSGAFF